MGREELVEYVRSVCIWLGRCGWRGGLVDERFGVWALPFL